MTRRQRRTTKTTRKNLLVRPFLLVVAAIVCFNTYLNAYAVVSEVSASPVSNHPDSTSTDDLGVLFGFTQVKPDCLLRGIFRCSLQQEIGGFRFFLDLVRNQPRLAIHLFDQQGTVHVLEQFLNSDWGTEHEARVSFVSGSHLTLQVDRGEVIFYQGILPKQVFFVQLQQQSVAETQLVHNLRIQPVEDIPELFPSHPVSGRCKDPQFTAGKGVLLSPGRCAGQPTRWQKKDSTTSRTRHLSVSLWLNIEDTALTSGEACIFSASGLKISYIGLAALSSPALRLTLLDEDNKYRNWDLPYHLFPGCWHHVALSYVGGSRLLFSLDESVLDAREKHIPNFVLVDADGLYCSRCSRPFSRLQKLRGRVANIFMSLGAEVSPLDLIMPSLQATSVRQAVGSTAHSSASRLNLGLAILPRTRSTRYVFEEGEYTPHLKALCSSLRFAEQIETLLVILDRDTIKDDLRYSSICDLNMSLTFAPFSSLDWVTGMYTAAEMFHQKVDFVIFSDPGMLFTQKTLFGLMTTLTASNSYHIACSIVVDLHSSVQFAGYQLSSVPVVDADYVLPVQQFRGYPLPVVQSSPELSFSTISGHVFAMKSSHVLKALSAFKPIANFRVALPPALTDVDLFMQLESAGFRGTLAKESVVISVASKAEHDFFDDPARHSDAINVFQRSWKEKLVSSLAGRRETQVGVRWMMHCAGSMGGEALTLISGLANRIPLRTQITRPVPYCEHNKANIETSPLGLQQLYHHLLALGPQSTPEIVIYHRDYRLFGELMRGSKNRYNIARYMFEGNGTLHDVHIRQMLALDEIWVPSQFHKTVLVENGLSPGHVMVIPEAIDVEYLQQSAKLHLPLHIPGAAKTTFTFLSVFKMEDRKGWQQLLQAYCGAFNFHDDVILVLHTHIYGDSDPWNANAINKKIDVALGQLCHKSKKERPKVYVTGRQLSSIDMLRLYKAADAYVSAHWGEGWGLPLSEAMSLGVPAIATDFSGNTEFMNHANSYLVPIAYSVPYEGDEWFQGLHHGVIDVDALRYTLTHVFEHRELARARGALGRKTMENKFTPAAVADIIIRQVQKIEHKLAAGYASAASASDLRSNPGFIDTPEMSECPAQVSTHRLPQPLSAVKQKVAIISTYPPRPCGIAIYTQQLVKGMIASHPEIDIEVFALVKQSDTNKYPSEVSQTIREDVLSDYKAVAAYINNQGFDLVFLQHEFGIYGPRPFGGYATCLAGYISRPLITTFHTVITRLTDQEGSILQVLSLLSTKVTVMTEVSRKVLETSFIIHKNVAVIPHGAPLVPSTSNREVLRRQNKWEEKIVLMSNGLLHRGKGLEVVIEALPELLQSHPHIIFKIIGKPHPADADSKVYVEELKKLSAKRKVSHVVEFISEYVEYDTLLDMLISGDIYVAPYTEDAVSSSGTITMAMAAGLPCIATPFVYVKDVFRDRRGKLVDFGDVASLADAVRELAEDDSLRFNMGGRAKQFMRERTWSETGRAHLDLI